MPAPRPTFRPRPLGGFNQGMGDQNEHMDDSAMQAAMQQNALTQQSSSTSPVSGGSNSAAPPSGLPPGGMAGAPATPDQPREVGSLTEELITRPLQDIGKELKSFFSINQLLGIDPVKDDPQTQAHKKQLHQRWNKIDQEDKAYVQKKYEAETKRKQTEKEQDELKKQQQAQQSQDIVVPSGPKKGAVGPGGSKKQKATQKLEQDRKTLSGPKGSN